MDLHLTVRSDHDAVVTLRAVGEIDLDNAFMLRDAVTTVLAAKTASKIVIDLAAVPVIDSVGTGVLVSCYYAAAACQVPMVVTNPQPLIYRQLWICGLVGLFGLPTPASERLAMTPTTPTSAGPLV